MKKLMYLFLVLFYSVGFGQQLLQRFEFEDNLTNVAGNVTMTSSTEQFTDGFKFGNVPNPNFTLFPGQEPFLLEKALRVRNQNSFGSNITGNYRVNSPGIGNLPGSDQNLAFSFWLKMSSTTINAPFDILYFAAPDVDSNLTPPSPQGFRFQRLPAIVNSNTTHSRVEVVGDGGTVLAWAEAPHAQFGGWNFWTVSYVRYAQNPNVAGRFFIGRNGAPFTSNSTDCNFNRQSFNTFRLGQNVTSTATSLNFDMDDLRIWDGISVGQFDILYKGIIQPTADQTQTVCAGSTIANLQVAGWPGATVQWFQTSGAGAPANTVLLNNTDYDVAQTVNGILSNKVRVRVTVLAATPEPTSLPSTIVFCAGAPPYTGADIPLVPGFDLTWWTTATATSPITVNSALTGSGTYFVSQTVNGCGSARIARNLTFQNPAAPTGAANQTILPNSTLTNIITNISNINWYASAANASNNTNQLSLSTLLTNGATYYAVQNLNGCRGTGVLAVTVTLGVASTTWNGTAWSNSSPTSTVNAIFAGNFTAATNITANAVTVTGTSNVVFPATFNLTAAGAIVVNNSASLTFESNANLIQTSSATNTGDITMKQLTSIRRLDYTYWGSGVTGQNLFAFSPDTLPNRFYTYSEITGAFVSASPATNNFVAGRGYSIRAPNNFSLTAFTNFMGVATGVPNNGTYNLTITTTASPTGGDGFNLIANPYPSAISAASFITTNPGTMYFWTSGVRGGGVGNYATFNSSGGTSSVLTGMISLPNGTVAKAQGFVFKAAQPSTTTVSFINAMRTGTSSTQFFRMAAMQSNKLWLNLVGDNDAFSQTLVCYNPQMTAGFDASYDAPQINKSGTVLSSVLDAELLAIQTKGNFVNTDVVPMAINIETAGTYNISIDHTEGIFGNTQNVFLKDNATGTTHNLSQSAYSFVATAGNVNNRFELRYQAAALGVNNNALSENSIIAFKNNGVLKIQSTVKMESVEVFDIRGALLFSAKDVNSNTIDVSNLIQNNAVLIARIKADGQTVSKKVIF